MNLPSCFRPARLGLALWVGLLIAPARAQGLDESLPALFAPPADAPGPIARQAAAYASRPRVRRVAVDFSQLRSLGGLDRRVRLPLFADADFTARFDAPGDDAGEFTGWTGTLEGRPNSWVNATFDGKALVLRAFDGRDRLYSVDPQSDGSHAVAEAPGGLQGVCGVESPPAGKKEARRQGQPARAVNPQNPNGNTWVDVLILYTWSAVAQASGNVTVQGPVRARANHWINHANYVHERSGSQVRLRLVGLEVLEFDDFDQNLKAQLGRIATNTTVIARRDALGADLVCLMPYGRANSGNTLGIAHTPGWASVVDSTQDALVFTHEIGHNLGCNHEIGSEGTPNEGYNHGYSHTETWSFSIFTTSVEKRVTTMFSGFSNGTRTDYFSNPNVQFEFTGGIDSDGIHCGGLCANVMRPLGVANSADNVRYLNEVRADRAVSRPAQFYVAPGADGTATALNPENDVSDVYFEWFPNTEVDPAAGATILIAAGNYPGVARFDRKSRLEVWNGGVARLGP